MTDDHLYRRGVGIMLLNSHKQVWVGRRIDNRDPAWQMPQGGNDAGAEGGDPGDRAQTLAHHRLSDDAEALAVPDVVGAAAAIADPAALEGRGERRGLVIPGQVHGEAAFFLRSEVGDRACAVVAQEHRDSEIIIGAAAANRGDAAAPVDDCVE
ncbi:MAG: hypothetical protein V4491_03870 [Pseudomonadota bacterium]